MDLPKAAAANGDKLWIFINSLTISVLSIAAIRAFPPKINALIILFFIFSPKYKIKAKE